VRVHCAGVAADGSGGLVTAGGRVVAVTALAPTIAAARDTAYAAVGEIDFPGAQFRTDIAEAAAAVGRIEQEVS